MSDRKKIDLAALLLTLSPVSLMTLEETVRRFRKAFEHSKEPSSEAIRIETEIPSGQMSSTLSSTNGSEIEVDPHLLLPNSTEVQTKKIASLINDVNKIQSRRRVKPAPTLATGRRNLKNEKVSDEEARKRCKRRDSNRLSAQRSREKRSNIANELEEQALKLEKANSIILKSIQDGNEAIKQLTEALRHSCNYTDATQPRAQQQTPVTVLPQPMSASSCGSDYPVSNTSQGLTPPPMNEDIVIKHSPPDSFDQTGALTMRTTLNIPAVSSVSAPSAQSYLAQLHTVVPDQPSQVPTTYFQTDFCDSLSTPVMSYGYNNMEYSTPDIGSVIPSMNDTDGMNMP